MGDKQQGDITTRGQAGSVNDNENAEDISVTPKDKYSYYILQELCGLWLCNNHWFWSSLLFFQLTTFAGKSLGFASLTVAAFVGFLAVFIIPVGTRMIGSQRSLLLCYLLLLLFVAGQYYVSPYTILPAAVSHGIGNSLFWACSATYLSKLAVDYAAQCKINHEKMISFANGHLMGCYGAAILLGNALSSSILLPADLDEEAERIGNDSCNLEQSTEDINPYNAYVMVLRGVLLLGSCVAFIMVLFFVDKVKGENPDFTIKGFLVEIKQSNIQFLKSCTRDKPYILLGFPITITSSLVQGYIYGSFPKVIMY